MSNAIRAGETFEVRPFGYGTPGWVIDHRWEEPASYRSDQLRDFDGRTIVFQTCAEALEAMWMETHRSPIDHDAMFAAIAADPRVIAERAARGAV